MILGRFIYITGCDGTGKTTQAKLLLQQLQEQGIKNRHVWLRFPFFFSIPFLVYARLRGYSWHEETNGVRHSYWDFRRSWIMRYIFPWVLLLDAALAAIWEIYLPLLRGETVVCERFVLDMIVDLRVAYGVYPMSTRLFWRPYYRLLPNNTQLVILDLDVKTIHARRKDLRNDNLLSDRVEAFRALAQDIEVNMISSTLPIMEVNRIIVKS